MKSLFFKTLGQNITLFISKYKRYFLLVMVIVTLISIFDTNSILAANPTDVVTDTPPTQPSSMVETYATMIDLLNKVLAVAATFIGLLTALVTMFLSPEWVTGSIFGLHDHLKTLWVIVSNLVYVVFIGIFIAIAFMNIIGKGENNWALKKALPKFFIGVLMVPISWMLVQTIISISSILTVTALTLPYDNFKTEDFFTNVASENAEKNLCRDFTIDFGASFGESAATTSDTDTDLLGSFVTCKDETKINIWEYFNGSDSDSLGAKNSIFGVISVYAYGIFNLDEITQIEYNGTESVVKHFTQLAVTTLISALFVIIFLALLAAIFVVLFTRGILLWFYSVISPVFGIFYFFGDGGGEMSKKINFMQLIKLALVPVFVSLALSFGLLFLVITGNGMSDNGSETEEIIWDNKIEAGGFTFELQGTDKNNNLFPDLQNSVGVLILQIFALLFLWIAVMAALKSSDAVSKVVAPFDDFGKKIGGLALDAPKYAPIIPGKGGTSTNLAGLTQMVEGASTFMRNKGMANNDDWQRMQGFIQDDASDAIKDLRRISVSSSGDTINIETENREEFTQLMYNTTSNTINSSPILRNQVQELLGLSDQEIKNFDRHKEDALRARGFGTELNNVKAKLNNDSENGASEPLSLNSDVNIPADNQEEVENGGEEKQIN